MEGITIGDLSIQVTRKAIKNVHLSVYPPDGKVTLSAPSATRLDVARAYAITRLKWIRDQQKKLRSQARETPRAFIERESHYLWGRRYLLTIAYREAKPSVSRDHKRITLTVRPRSDEAKRAAVIHDWHKSLLHEAVLPREPHLRRLTHGSDTDEENGRSGGGIGTECDHAGRAQCDDAIVDEIDDGANTQHRNGCPFGTANGGDFETIGRRARFTARHEGPDDLLGRILGVQVT